MSASRRPPSPATAASFDKLATLPKDRPLTDKDLRYYAKVMRIPHFRGVYMRNKLPRKPNVNERAVVNLDDESGPGTHWVAYSKKGLDVLYYDSYGNLQPPVEIKEYLSGCKIRYNFKREQKFATKICGHLCLMFLNKTRRLDLKKKKK